MGDIFTEYERDTIAMLEKPDGLAFLIFWWLGAGDDRKFRDAAGFGENGQRSLPSFAFIFPSDDHPVFCHQQSYESRRVKPLLQFAWEHGFIIEVMKCQSALRSIGLDKYCIGASHPAPNATR
jgi:hypothetical protein